MIIWRWEGAATLFEGNSDRRRTESHRKSLSLLLTDQPWGEVFKMYISLEKNRFFFSLVTLVMLNTTHWCKYGLQLLCFFVLGPLERTPPLQPKVSLWMSSPGWRCWYSGRCSNYPSSATCKTVSLVIEEKTLLWTASPQPSSGNQIQLFWVLGKSIILYRSLVLIRKATFVEVLRHPHCKMVSVESLLQNIRSEEHLLCF